MTYRVNADLPEHVQDALPIPAQTFFRKVASSALDVGLTKDRAHRKAWAEVRKRWQKVSGGQWVRYKPELSESLTKIAPRQLYVCRKVVNAQDIITWAKSQGFKTTYPADELHVTIAFSRQPVDWMRMPSNSSIISSDDSEANKRRGVPLGGLWTPPGGPRVVEPLGPAQVIVLHFSNSYLSWRNRELRDAGCSWDYPDYSPHITITRDAGDVDLKAIEPYRGDIVLGPEEWNEIKDGAMDAVVEKADGEAGDEDDDNVTMLKVDPKLGLVFGWAIVCKNNGQDYYDRNIDKNGERVPEHIPEATMLEAALDFAENSGLSKDMHEGDPDGTTPFVFPMTTEIAKAMGLSGAKTGLMLAMKPSPKVLQRFLKGEYRGFSIGGRRVAVEEI